MVVSAGASIKITLGELAEITGGQAVGDPDRIIAGAAPFESAGQDDLTLAGSGEFLKRIHEVSAAAIIVPTAFGKGQNLADNAINLLLADNPRAAFAKALNIFFPAKQYRAGIHPSACIGQNFSCGRHIHIGASVTIGDNVTLGSNVTLHPGVFLGDGVTTGDSVEIHPNVSILWGTIIGSRVIIHAGAVIGSDGFGFAPDGEIYHKIPHAGFVQIDDDVEIGANNCIDRSTFGRTWIKSGVKTDNLVQIAHNVTIGKNTVIAGASGVAGSATIGDHVVIAGQTGISGHLNVGDNATIGPKSGVLKPVGPNEIVSGMPAISHKQWLRSQLMVARLPDLGKQIRNMEKRLTALEERKKEKNSDPSDSNH